MPAAGARRLLALTAAASALLAGCLAPAADPPLELHSQTTAVAPTLVVQFLLVVEPDAAELPSDAAARVDAAAAPLLDAFEAASRERVRLASAGPARVLPLPTGVATLDEAPHVLARAYFASPDAPRDVHFLVLVAGDGVPVASDACACVAWHQRARNPSTLGDAMDTTRAFGAPPQFIGVTALGSLAELADAHEMEYRFLHETGHAWCCRLPEAAAQAGVLAARGAHWTAAAWSGDGPRDPLVGDGSEFARGAVEWRFSDLTLVAMGVLDAAAAEPLRVADGRLVSAADVLSLSTA